MLHTINRLNWELLRFLRDEEGASAIEYAIIAIGISIVILGAVTAIGQGLFDDYYTPVSNSIG